MKKLNNKGFVMMETLVVAVFIMVIFSIMYTNYYPLIGEYERREVYDDVDSKYAAFWIKRFIQHDSFPLTATMITRINNYGYVKVSCNSITDDYRKIMCNKLVNELEVKGGSSSPNIYLTKYNLTDFKTFVKSDNNYSTFSSALHDYVEYLPKYDKVASLNFADYRIVVEFERKKNDVTYYAYSTIEVKK